VPKLPALSGKEVIAILSKAGFEVRRQSGSHVILTKFVNEKKIAVVVPNHKEVDRGTLVEIIRQARLSRDEFLKMASKI